MPLPFCWYVKNFIRNITRVSNVIVIFRYIETSKRINSIDIQILFYITFYEYDFAEIQSTNLRVRENQANCYQSTTKGRNVLEERDLKSHRNEKIKSLMKVRKESIEVETKKHHHR